MSGKADPVAVPTQLSSEGYKWLDVAATSYDLHDDVQPDIWRRLTRVLVGGRFILGFLVDFTQLWPFRVEIFGNESA